MTKLRIGTRSSRLALWQAEYAAHQIQSLGHEAELVLIETSGDLSSGPIGQLGGQGVFTKEIQRALLDERVDVAVHSLKDLPTESIEELALTAVPPREIVNDVLLSDMAEQLEGLPAGARVGTGSVRRRAQLLSRWPDLRMCDIRGNVQTRVEKLRDGQYDAVILAEAGLRRLGMGQLIRQRIPIDVLLPAVGQGALGLECRKADRQTREIVQLLTDPDTWAAVTAERQLLAKLRGGCQAPVAAYGRVKQSQLELDARVLSPDGSRMVRTHACGPTDEARELGDRAAADLLEQGAAELIDQSRSA